MIQGIGIDTVDIKRFAHWHQFPHKNLLRLFRPAEIAYCMAHAPQLTAQHFAVRFAAREAFFKALSAMKPELRIPFLTICRKVELVTTGGAPSLAVDWQSLIGKSALIPRVFLSVTHSKETATAFIIITSCETQAFI